MCSEKRLKPQRELLEQAKEMRIRKKEKDQILLLHNNKKKKYNKKSISINDQSDNSILPPINNDKGYFLTEGNSLHIEEVNDDEKNNDNEELNV